MKDKEGIRFLYYHYRFTDASLPMDTDGPPTTHTGRHGKAYRFRRKMSKWQPRACGGYTLCAIVDADGEQLGGGWAECSPRDQFCYRTGREISRERAIMQALINVARRL